MGKLAEKLGENRRKRDGNWRQLALFPCSQAPFRGARYLRLHIASRQAANL
jgi:hypothetical protein